MIRKLKRENNILILCLALSLVMHLVFGIEGAGQAKEMQFNLNRLEAQLHDKDQQIEVLEIMLEHQEEPEESEPTETHLGEFEITYYCPCTKCCGPNAVGITYTGTVAQEGRTVAVDPEVISMGSTVVIDGQTYIAEDTGSAIKGNKIDIFKDSHIVALEGGRHKADVYIVEDTKDVKET